MKLTVMVLFSLGAIFADTLPPPPPDIPPSLIIELRTIERDIAQHQALILQKQIAHEHAVALISSICGDKYRQVDDLNTGNIKCDPVPLPPAIPNDPKVKNEKK